MFCSPDRRRPLHPHHLLDGDELDADGGRTLCAVGESASWLWRGSVASPRSSDESDAYAAAGTISQMEAVYLRHKRVEFRISRTAIRAVVSAYIARQKYFKLGAFARDAGLARRRVAGGRTLLLWNLYLLSFTANFSSIAWRSFSSTPGISVAMPACRFGGREGEGGGNFIRALAVTW